MKFIYSSFSLLLFLVMPTLALSVNVVDLMREPATKIETYWSEPEKFIITDVYYLGDMKEPAVGFEALVSYEPGLTTKVRGIRVYTRGDDIADRYFAFIDFDDIEGLSKAIIKMIEINKEQQLAPGKIRRDALYSCKGGFKVQLQQLQSHTRLFLTGRYLSVALPPENLTLLKDFLGKAQDFLNAK